MEKIHSKIKSLSTFKLILLSLAMVFIVDLFTFPFSQSYSRNLTSDDINRLAQELITIPDLIRNILNKGIFSPIIETLIFQTLIIRFVLAWTCILFSKENYLTYFIPVLISSLIFGFAHFGYNSLAKIIQTFLIGIILAYTYVVAYITNKKATFSVICVHSFSNSFLLILASVLLIIGEN